MEALAHAGVVLASQPEPRKLSTCSLCSILGVSMIVFALFKSRVSVSYSSKLHWFSNQLRGLLFLVSDPRVEVPNMGLSTLLPREGTQACDILLFFRVSS